MRKDDQLVGQKLNLGLIGVVSIFCAIFFVGENFHSTACQSDDNAAITAIRSMNIKGKGGSTVGGQGVDIGRNMSRLCSKTCGSKEMHGNI